MVQIIVFFVVMRRLVDIIAIIPATISVVVGYSFVIIGANIDVVNVFARSISDNAEALIVDGTTLFLT